MIMFRTVFSYPNFSQLTEDQFVTTFEHTVTHYSSATVHQLHLCPDPVQGEISQVLNRKNNLAFGNNTKEKAFPTWFKHVQESSK